MAGVNNILKVRNTGLRLRYIVKLQALLLSSSMRLLTHYVTALIIL
jgi:hypothetical protein